MNVPDIYQLIENSWEAARKARETAQSAREAAEMQRQAQDDHWQEKQARRESVLHLFEFRQEARQKKQKVRD